MRRIFAFITLLLLTSLYAFGKEPYPSEEKCQNALASLTCYLEQTYDGLTKNNEGSDTIEFSPENVESLWHTLEALCLHSPFEAYTPLISEALHDFNRYRETPSLLSQKELVACLYQSYLKIRSLWYVGMDQDPIQVLFEDLEEKKTVKKDRQLLAMHLHQLLHQKKASTTDKNKYVNLLNWTSSQGSSANRNRWRRWEHYYSTTNADPLIATLLASTPYNDFKANPKLNKSARKKLRPYLLPTNHHSKAILDSFFLTSRISQDPQTLESAGFTLHSKQGRSFIHVASHPQLPEYLLKIVVDSELRKKIGKPEWMWFARRCECAKRVEHLIKKHKIQHFTVPNKWIYPLPLKPAPPSTAGYSQKPVILLVKKMDLVSHAKTLDTWKNHINKAKLKELYTIVSRIPRVSIRPDNLPLTTNGKFAFVDTEYRNGSPAYEFIRSYLSKEMQTYWDHLVKQGGD
ncbi:MAG: hypothetical protein CK425_10630 [Parachlamydia sp.]|nr:MAG: hypothetical protein CK425_10630 [Parachlamydia sp.]